MNKKLLSYTLIGLLAMLVTFIFLNQSSVKNESLAKTVLPKTTGAETHTVVERPIIPALTASSNGGTIHAETEEEHDEHGSEFYTEMMPKTRAKTADVFNPPQTDSEKLGFILGAAYSPVHDDSGEFAGLKVSSLPDAVLTAPSMKLQNGDIITQINGLRMVNEESFGEAVEQLLSSGAQDNVVTFDVERNGVPYSISLDVQL